MIIIIAKQTVLRSDGGQKGSLLLDCHWLRTERRLKEVLVSTTQLPRAYLGHLTYNCTSRKPSSSQGITNILHDFGGNHVGLQVVFLPSQTGVSSGMDLGVVGEWLWCPGGS